MKIIATQNPDVLLIEPKVFYDERGFFLESYNSKSFRNLGITSSFVQDNHSSSKKNVLRGLHYQTENPQGKLVRVIAGEIFDVVVDLRRGSPYFGKWASARLSSENKHLLWIPPGFGHGFLVLSNNAEVLYKATDFYNPRHEHTILWNDPDLAIDWPLSEPAIVSVKDQQGHPFNQAPVYEAQDLNVGSTVPQN